MIRRREPDNRLFYAHDELPGVSPTNFYMRLQGVVQDWEALAKPLWPAFSERMGRPTDPVVYLKAFLVGYLENIIYDTDLADRLSDSLAIRRFLGFGPGERTPDHWTLGRVRMDVARYCSIEEVLDEVVGQCVGAGLVDGKGTAVDGSLVPANASLSSLRSLQTGKSVAEHLREARASNAGGKDGQAQAQGTEAVGGHEEAEVVPGDEPVGCIEGGVEGVEANLRVEEGELEAGGAGMAPESVGAAAPVTEGGEHSCVRGAECHGEMGEDAHAEERGAKGGGEEKSPEEASVGGPGRVRSARPSISNAEFRSATDPDARLIKKGGAPRDMYYRATHLVDGKSGIILAAGAAHADEGEPESAQPVLAQAQATLMMRGLALGMVGTDSGYDSSDFHAYVEALGAQPVSNYHEEAEQKPKGFRKEDFHYILENRCYLCPRGCLLRYKCQDGKRERYVSDPADCAQCPDREKCLEEGSKERWLARNYTESARERSLSRCHTEEGRALLKARKHIVEPTFGRMKTYGGLGLMNCRGLTKANVKVVMAAVAWNLIRMVNCLNPARKSRQRAGEARCSVPMRCRRPWGRLAPIWWRIVPAWAIRGPQPV